MRTVMLTLLATLLIVFIAGFAFIYTGAFDVAATRPHWPVTHWVLETVRTQSIKAQAAGITPPANLMSDANIITGAEHFAAHCASCHSAPGVPRGDIGNGLYPQPPELAHAAQHYTPGELFWIVKNGIKMTGMPAWKNKMSDTQTWSVVAWLEASTKLPPQTYSRWRAGERCARGSISASGSSRR